MFQTHTNMWNTCFHQERNSSRFLDTRVSVNTSQFQCKCVITANDIRSPIISRTDHMTVVAHHTLFWCHQLAETRCGILFNLTLNIDIVECIQCQTAMVYEYHHGQQVQTVPLHLDTSNCLHLVQDCYSFRWEDHIVQGGWGLLEQILAPFDSAKCQHETKTTAYFNCDIQPNQTICQQYRSICSAHKHWQDSLETFSGQYTTRINPVKKVSMLLAEYVHLQDPQVCAPPPPSCLSIATIIIQWFIIPVA